MTLHPDQLRCLVQDCIAKHLYATAVFYADKLVTLTEYAPGDVYLLAQVSSEVSAACWSLLRSFELTHSRVITTAHTLISCVAVLGRAPTDVLCQQAAQAGGDAAQEPRRDG